MALETKFFKRIHKGLSPIGRFLYKGSMKIVSACLAGIPCRYDCQAKERAQIKEWVDKGAAIAVCPEQMGGLPTPRPPAEIQGRRVITAQGKDVTDEYQTGAQAALDVARSQNCVEAYLKSKSPMCGVGRIYDGTFQGQVKSGDGIFTKMLIEAGVQVHEVD